MGKRGPAPSGRVARSVRFAHHEVYAEAARIAGVDFTRYVNEVMARAHGLALDDDGDPIPGTQLALSADIGPVEEDAA